MLDGTLVKTKAHPRLKSPNPQGKVPTSIQKLCEPQPLLKLCSRGIRHSFYTRCSSSGPRLHRGLESSSGASQVRRVHATTNPVRTARLATETTKTNTGVTNRVQYEQQERPARVGWSCLPCRATDSLHCHSDANHFIVVHCPPRRQWPLL